MTRLIVHYKDFDTDSDAEYLVTETQARRVYSPGKAEVIEESRVSLGDSGNDLTISLGKKKLVFSYSELEELLVLLKYREINEKHEFTLHEMKEYRG